MNEQVFYERRKDDWQRLTVLTDKAEFNPAQLKPDDLREFVRLYRRVSTDLSVVRTKSTNLALIEFLNSLLGRSYGVLYRAPRKSIFSSIADAIALAAQTVRRRKMFVLVSAALFFGAWFGTLGVLSVRPDLKTFLIPEQMQSSFDQWRSGKFPERESSQSLAATGFYMSNNPKAAIFTGAVGAGTFGLASLFMVLTNGALIGALSHEVLPVGKLGFLLSSIFPHGVPELSGLIISGSSGLLLGYALINPGRKRRGEALREVGRDAVTLLAISVTLMFIAAPIEGFFSFNPTVPGWVKVIVGTVSLTAWLLFWTQYAPEPKPADPKSREPKPSEIRSSR